MVMDATTLLLFIIGLAVGYLIGIVILITIYIFNR